MVGPPLGLPMGGAGRRGSGEGSGRVGGLFAQKHMVKAARPPTTALQPFATPEPSNAQELCSDLQASRGEGGDSSCRQ